MYRDKSVTGRLEVTLYLNTKDDSGSDGVVIHSRSESGKFIHEDYKGFMMMLDEAMASAKWFWWSLLCQIRSIENSMKSFRNSRIFEGNEDQSRNPRGQDWND